MAATQGRLPTPFDGVHHEPHRPVRPLSGPPPAPHRLELRFVSLFDEGRGYAFPCDAEGHVDLDALSERLKLNYLYVRKLIGRDFSTPAVRPTLQ